jgi:hemerythrin-like domain-containing protein
MKAIDDLKHEHRVIELVLTGLDRIAERADAERTVEHHSAERALEILRNFADKCHHGKEERHLFPLMEARGVARQGGPIGVMLHEHELGRGHIRAMVQALPEASSSAGEAVGAFTGNARRYVGLLRQHIQKEENVLFPMAEQLLTAQDDDGLVEGFETIEREEIGEGAHEKYHQWAHDLAEHHG